MIEMVRSKALNLFFSLALIVICGRGLRAQSFMATHTKVELVAEQNTLETGHPNWIGVLFDMEKGWHIYWVNPGESGEAPKFQWQLPAGFHAGEVRWPAPARLGTGTVIDYGYEGKVLLPLQLAVPASYKPGTPVTLAADVRYLICRDVCIPAKTQVKLTLPTANAAPGDATARRSLFNETQERWPRSLPAGWKVQVSDSGKSFVLNLETGMKESQTTFFPLDQDQIDNEAPQSVTPSATGVRITLKKSDQLTKPISVLRGVVVFGPDRSYEIAAPISAHR